LAAQHPSSGAKETADAKQRERSQDSLIEKDFILFLESAPPIENWSEV